MSTMESMVIISIKEMTPPNWAERLGLYLTRRSRLTGGAAAILCIWRKVLYLAIDDVFCTYQLPVKAWLIRVASILS